MRTIYFDISPLLGPDRTRGIGRYSAALFKALGTLGGVELVAISTQPVEGSAGITSRALGIPEAEVEHAYQRYLAGSSAASSPAAVVLPNLLAPFDREVFRHLRRHFPAIPVAGIVHDLIPWVFPSFYLRELRDLRRHSAAIANLGEADLICTVSRSTKAEVEEIFGIPPSRVRVIGGGAAQEEVGTPARSLGPGGSYIFAVSSIEWRKNLKFLIAGYASLAERLRKRHRLVVLVPPSPRDNREIVEFATQAGVSTRLDLVSELNAAEVQHYYSEATLVVQPSIYEGLGLPVLEAVQAEAPLISSRYPASEEILGAGYDGFFAPDDLPGFTGVLTRALADEAFRSHLRRSVSVESWDFAQSARELLSVLPATAELGYTRAERPSLAVVTPVLPQRSGAATFTENLLPHLSPYYAISVVAEDGLEGPGYLPNSTPEEFASTGFDRILYVMGNSSVHTFELDAIGKNPGVVEMHDAYLSGMLRHAQVTEGRRGVFFNSVLATYGLLPFLECPYTVDCECLVQRLMASRSVLCSSLGSLVHSEEAQRLLASECGAGYPATPVPITAPGWIPTLPNRKRLTGLGNITIFASFGAVAKPKRSLDILAAWRSAGLSDDTASVLIFAGAVAGDPYGAEFTQEIGGIDNAFVTGWLDNSSYLAWLEMADIAIQLRRGSRGESSGAILECCAHGIPVVFNRHGSFAEIDPGVGVALPDDFAIAELSEALRKISDDRHLRTQASELGREWSRKNHSPWLAGKSFRDAIEATYAIDSEPGLPDLPRTMIVSELFSQLPANDSARSQLVARVRTQLSSLSGVPAILAYPEGRGLRIANRMMSVLSGYDLGDEDGYAEVGPESSVLELQ